MTKRSTFKLLAGVSAASLLCIPGYALAQSSPSAPSAREAEQMDAGEADAEQQIGGDIIVTAQKRSQRLNDVGLTIAAVTGDVLAQRQISSLQDIANAIPGLSFSRSITGSPIYTLRGVGFYDTALASYPTTSVYVDEVALAFPTLAAHSAFDLDHLEVLKGPQGTLFGQNSTGGAINYIANKPTDVLEAGASLTYGRFNQVNAEAFISGPIADTLTARIAGRVEHMDGWQISNSRPGDRNGKIRNYMGRATVDFEPRDGMKFTLNANGWIDNSETQAPQFIGIFPQFAGFVSPKVLNTPFSPQTPQASDWTPGVPHSRNRFWQTSLRGDVEVTDGVTLTSITAYTHYRHNQGNDNDGLPASVEEVTKDIGTIKSFSQELRISNGGGHGFRWVLGGNYSRDSVEESYTNFYPDSSANGALGAIGFPISQSQSVSAQKMRNIAGFANGEFDLTSQLTLKLGARYTESRRSASQCAIDPGTPPATGNFFYDVLLGGTLGSYQPGDCFSINFTLPGRPPETLGGIPPGSPGRYISSFTENNISWRAGVDYKLSRDVLFYVNVSKGYKAGSYPISPASNVAQFERVTQESVLSYEGGFKASFANNALQFNGAAFYYEYKDKQLRTQFIDPVFGVLGILANIPRSSIRGFELEATARPTSGLSIGAAFTYLDAVIDEYVGDNIAGGQAATGTKFNYKGFPIPYTPKYQFAANIDYTFPLNDRLNGFVGANLNMRSRADAIIGGRTPVGTISDIAHVYRIDSYTTVDGQIGVTTANDKFRATLWAKNLFNEYYFTNVIPAFDTLARYTAMPRTFGVTVATKF